MSELQPQDDFIHPTGKEPAWREAFYFDFFDPESRLSSFGYVGVHPNQQVGDVIFALWKEDVLLGSFTRWDFNIPTDIGEERLGFGHLFFRPVDPFKTWQIFYDDGRCRVELTFDAVHPAYSWGQSHGALEKTNSHHYEQQGRYTGEVRVGDQRYKIHAAGVRDHAWGWGARAGIRRWIWASAQFSEEFAWNSFQVTLGDGRDILYGYIWRGKQNELIRRSTMQAQYATPQVPITIVRPPIVFGEGDLQMRTVFRSIFRFGVHLAIGVAHSHYSLIHVRDLVSALLLCAQRGARLAPGPSTAGAVTPARGYYFVAGEEQPTFAELGLMIGNCLGRQHVRVWRSSRTALLWSAAALAEATARLRGQPYIFNFDKAREAQAGNWTCSAKTLQGELGFAPQASLVDRLAETAAWYRRQNLL